MAKLVASRYGKARVRVLKVLRDGDVHRLRDVDVAVLLEGDFETSYTGGDNSKVVATDTIKNTVNVLAKDHLGDEIERFAMFLGEHFAKKYTQVNRAKIDISEREWRRMEIGGKPHPHSFVSGGDARMFTRVAQDRQSHVIESGIRDLVILKSTGSGFEKYPRDEFTTLRETSDRILATSFSATWRFREKPKDFRAANEAIIVAMMKPFAENYSPSAQTTLFQMGEAALAACREIEHVDLAMPNKHCLLIDLSPFGLENKNEVFVPIDEPHGQIECSVARDD
ncbi:MAG: urate oxidase [Verrucomicrobiota bacterium]|jgi:urate oxidase